MHGRRVLLRHAVRASFLSNRPLLQSSSGRGDPGIRFEPMKIMTGIQATVP